MLLKVDFIQTALARREEMVRTLYERGELRPEVGVVWCGESHASNVQLYVFTYTNKIYKYILIKHFLYWLVVLGSSPYSNVLYVHVGLTRNT